jgi:hypothetical protein
MCEGSQNLFIRLFYSTKCHECMNLWQVIYNEGIQRMFIPVCLDNFSSKDISRLSLREIPAIVISTPNTPPSVYQGPQQCSQWLTNFTINRRKNLIAQVEAKRRLIQKTHAIERAQGDSVIEFTDTEMEGVSDNYSYNHTDLCQPKNYVMIGQESNAIITPNIQQSKIDVNTLKNQLSMLESSRTDDNQNIMKIMEQNQIKAILNYNNDQ